MYSIIFPALILAENYTDIIITWCRVYKKEKVLIIWLMWYNEHIYETPVLSLLARIHPSVASISGHTLTTAGVKQNNFLE